MRRRVEAIGIGFDRRGIATQPHELFNLGRQRIGVEGVIPHHTLTGVRGHAAHVTYLTGERAALGFVVRLVITDGVEQILPFVLIGVSFASREFPRFVFRVRREA